MIKTTETYNKAVKNNRIFHHEAVIDFKDGTSITAKDMDLYTFQISDATSNTNSFDLGAATAQQLTLKLSNIDGRFNDHDLSGAVIHARVGLELPDDSIEWLDKGVFCAEPGEESGNTISVKAFDRMIKFDQPYSLSKLAYPATLGAIVRDACSCCEVPLASDTATFDNDGFIVQERPDDSALTCREILQWVGQIACKFFRIDRFGKLSARWYDTGILETTWIKKEDTVWTDINGEAICDTEGQEIGTIVLKTIKAGNTKTVDVNEKNEILKIDTLLSGSTVQTDDVVITGIRVTEESNEGEAVYQSGTDGYVLEISGNKLIQNGSGASVASYLGEQLNGIQFRPMTLNVPADPAREAGDLGLVIDSKGRYHKTIFTNVDYTAHAAQKLTSGAEAPTRLSSTRYSQATRVYKELRANIRRQKTEWDVAFKNLQNAMLSKNGLFPVCETMKDGSTILYFCDRPKLSDASIVVKFSAAGWAMSTDGGTTWNSGWLVDGTMIAAILNAIGVNAKWINAGSLVVKNAEGKVIFEVDMDKQSVYMSPDVLMIGDTSLTKKLQKMDENIAQAKNISMQLSNEYQAIATDSEGKIPGVFPDVSTTVTVMYGFENITNNCSYNITKSEAVAGNWNDETKTFTVTSLSTDDGWIDIRATYLQNLTVTKRFSVARQKAGEAGTVYSLEPSAQILKSQMNGTIDPNVINFAAYRKKGEKKELYKGRYKIEEYRDKTWTTMYSSEEDEAEVLYYLYDVLTDSSERAVTDGNGTVLARPRKIEKLRCSLYASGGTDTLIDTQNIDVLVDAATLTQEQIVSILSNGGAWEGMHYLNGRLYFSFSAALGGVLTLGGRNNGNGRLILRDDTGKPIGTLDNDGLTFWTSYDEKDTCYVYDGYRMTKEGIKKVNGSKSTDPSGVDMEIEQGLVIDFEKIGRYNAKALLRTTIATISIPSFSPQTTKEASSTFERLSDTDECIAILQGVSGAAGRIVCCSNDISGNKLSGVFANLSDETLGGTAIFQILQFGYIGREF